MDLCGWLAVLVGTMGAVNLIWGIDWPVNPLIQVDSTESLWKHLQNTVILCHFVSLLGMLCHLGGWDNGCRHMLSTTHKLPKPDKNTVYY